MASDPSRRFAAPWLVVLVAAALVAGVVFRVANLDRKFYSHDEAYTSLQISGYTKREAIADLFDGREIHPSDLQRYQRPGRDKGAFDTLMALAREEPHETPLYFLLARAWMQLWMPLFSNSVAVMRSLTVVLGLLVIPAFGWLAWELFRDRPTAWMSAALVSMSPIHVLYSQDARPYALWTLVIVVSSVALLRAVRLGTPRPWAVYSISAALGLYSHLLFGLVMAAHALYVLALRTFTRTWVVGAYARASAFAVLAFAPWIVVMAVHWREALNATTWALEPIRFPALVGSWALTFTSPLWDVHVGSGEIPMWLIRVSVLTLIAASVYVVWRSSEKRVWFFVVLLLLIPVLPLILPDVIWGGTRSLNARFLIPSFLGIELAVAYTLASRAASARRSAGLLGRTGACLVVLGGVLSGAASVSTDFWWNKWQGVATSEVARRINQAERPLVIVDEPYPTNLGDLLALSYSLDPRVRLRLGPRAGFIDGSDHPDEVLLFNPSDALRAVLERSDQRRLELAIAPLCLPPQAPSLLEFRCLRAGVLWRRISWSSQPG
jgi:uncharacterized membrane protein